MKVRTTRMRLLATTLMLLVPFGALVVWLRATYAEPGPLAPLDLPHRVGPWVAGPDESFSDDVVSRAGVDTYLLRPYHAPGRTSIWLYVGMYAALRGSGGKYHNPEGCYPRSGWEILDYQTLALDLDLDGQMLHAQEMKLEQEGHRRLVHYWFQPAERWPKTRSAEEIARVFDAMKGSPQYAFVRLSGPLTRGGEEQASRDLAEFASAIAQPVRHAVDNLRSPATGAIARSN
jgi:EpsI family protein